MPEYRIALVVPNLAHGGGVSSVADFIYHAVSTSGCFDVDLISLATSARDTDSVRVLRPLSWTSGIQLSGGAWKGRSYLHVGARWTELEFSRYLARGRLTQILNSYDLVQVIAGTPAWAMACRDVRSKVCLQVATLASVERERKLRVERGLGRWWRSAMTTITSRMEPRALSYVDRVFVENQWMYDVVERQIGGDRVVYAPPGVDTGLFKPAFERRGDRPSYILSVGRFADPRKNVPLLFESYAAFRELVADPPRLLLVGKSGPTGSDWSLAERLGIKEFVNFQHDLTVEELSKIYREADMFVLSSDEEGFGMVILEAMASGIPVVSTRSGGPDGIITDGVDGVLVPVKDPKALSMAMARICGRKAEADEMGAAARRSVEERFSLDRAGQVFVRTYIDLLERKPHQ